MTILQIADLHLFAGQEFLLHFLSDVASSERFDMVVATGDNFGSLDAFDMVMDASGRSCRIQVPSSWGQTTTIRRSPSPGRAT